MHPLLAEVAPVTPSTAVALGTLISLAGLLFAYGCTQGLRWTVQKVLGALAGWLSILPGIGGVTAGVVTSVEKALSNALGQAVSGIESHIGHQWHTLARFLSMLWAEQTLVAHNLWNIAKSFYGFANTNDVRRWVNELTHRLTKAEQTLHRTVTKEIHNATKVIHTTVREVAPGIHALTHAIDVTIPREIGNLRKRARAIEDSLGRLFTRVKALENSISAGAIAAVVATVLAAIGLDWLACRDGAHRAGRSGCNLWSDVGTLLGILGEVALFRGACDFLQSSNPLVSDVADFVIPAFTAVGAGLCPGSIGAPAPLPPIALYTPPNPGITLYLP